MAKSIKILLVVSMICTIILFGGTSVVFANTNYTFSDTTTSTDIISGGTRIFQNHMVWAGGAKDGSKQIFYKNLKTGETKQITNVNSPKESARVGVTKQGETIVVWTDKRNHMQGSNTNWDVYSYNLTTGKETKLNSTNGQFVSLVIDGNYVVWHNLSDKKMYLYDFTAKKDEYIGDGKVPEVRNGKIVFKNSGDGGLTLYTIATKEKVSLLELIYPYHVNNFTFNGEKVLWNQEDMSGNLQYRLMDVKDLNVINLTPSEKPATRFSSIDLGNHYGAWVQEKNGVGQIIGVNLSNGEMFQITNATKNQKLLGFDGDQVLMVSDNKKLIYRNILDKNNPQSSVEAPKEDNSNPSQPTTPQNGNPPSGYYDHTGKFITGKDLVHIKINGIFIEDLRPLPIVKNSSTYVPLRGVLERLNANVAWEGKTRTIEITLKDTKIKLVVDSQSAIVNGKTVQLQQAPFVQNDATYVPLRFLSENFGANVAWDSTSRVVGIEMDLNQ